MRTPVSCPWPSRTSRRRTAGVGGSSPRAGLLRTRSHGPRVRLCRPNRSGQRVPRYSRRLMVSGPGAWQVGIISTRLMLTCAGSPITQATVSATSSGVSGVVPA